MNLIEAVPPHNLQIDTVIIQYITSASLKSILHLFTTMDLLTLLRLVYNMCHGTLQL